jgi:hypothetical protein
LKTLTRIVLFFISGVLAGLISLIALAFFMFPDNPSDIFVFSSSALLEELVKLLFLALLLDLSRVEKTIKSLIPYIFVFGIAFSAFELTLLLIDRVAINYTFLYSTTLHIITSLLILFSIVKYTKKRKLSTISFTLFILAFFIHLCYNLVRMNFI